MATSYIFKHILGYFIISEQDSVVDEVLFDVHTTEEDISATVNKIKKKYETLKAALPHHTAIVHAHLANKKYFQRFHARLHSISARMIQQSVSREQGIIHAISAIEDLDKTINMLTKRLREWYDMFDPGLVRSTADHAAFVNKILEQKSIHKPNSSITKQDYQATVLLAKQVNQLVESRKSFDAYLRLAAKEVCPNTTAIAGPLITARLLRHAGSLKKLSRFPASTIQVLGAEKALFRHIRNKKNKAPKYGLLHEHPLVQQAKKEGAKAARVLADKISIASRLDYFKGSFQGDVMKAAIEKKFNLTY